MELMNLAFYTINPEYLEYLNEINSEVYFSQEYKEKMKPFVGILISINDYHYFIPLSSAKEKHKTWKKVSREHFLIYEKNSNENFTILALLDIKKMIPVPKDEYSKVNFSNIYDIKYRTLLEKEYKFCRKIKDKIQATAKKLYEEQKKTGKVQRFHCNFSALEEAMYDWIEKR